MPNQNSQSSPELLTAREQYTACYSAHRDWVRSVRDAQRDGTAAFLRRLKLAQAYPVAMDAAGKSWYAATNGEIDLVVVPCDPQFPDKPVRVWGGDARWFTNRYRR